MLSYFCFQHTTTTPQHNSLKDGLFRFPSEDTAPLFVRSREWWNKGWRRRRVGIRPAPHGPSFVLERPGGRAKAGDAVLLRNVIRVSRYTLRDDEPVGITTENGTEFRFGQIGVLLETAKEKVKLATSTIEAAETLLSWLLSFADDMRLADSPAASSLSTSFLSNSDLPHSPQTSFGRPDCSETDEHHLSLSLSSPHSPKRLIQLSSAGSPCSNFSPSSSPTRHHHMASPTALRCSPLSEGRVVAPLRLPNPVITMGAEEDSEEDEGNATVVSSIPGGSVSRASSPLAMSSPISMVAAQQPLGGSLTPSSSPLGRVAAGNLLATTPTGRMSLLASTAGNASPVRILAGSCPTRSPSGGSLSGVPPTGLLLAGLSSPLSTVALGGVYNGVPGAMFARPSETFSTPSTSRRNSEFATPTVELL